MTKYVIVTAISSFRIRYAIPVDELQSLNPNVSVEGREIEWANDCVVCGEVNEFSQEHVGETIIDSEIVDEKQILDRFDKENNYLSGWPVHSKLVRIRNWKA